MRIIGIDPGLAIIGFGILDCTANNAIRPVTYGCIKTPSTDPTDQRLLAIQKNLRTILQEYHPNTCGIERLYFSKNVKTAMTVSQACGVILCTLAEFNIPISDYTPTTVKSTIIGHGNATKHQIQFMTKELLGLAATPKPDDVADALAVGICHRYWSSVKLTP